MGMDRIAGSAIIDGKQFAAGLLENIKLRVESVTQKTGKVPGLAVVLVGTDPASAVYVGSKHRQTVAAGMRSFKYELPAEATQEELVALIARLNGDPEIHGILVQLPLPAHLDAQAVIRRINPDKDVDGFHPVNVGRLSTGLPALVPCTPLGCLMLLDRTRSATSRACDAVVVGSSNIVGKPMAQLLLARELHRDHRAFAHERPARARAARPTSWSPRSAGPSWFAATGSSPARW